MGKGAWKWVPSFEVLQRGTNVSLSSLEERLEDSRYALLDSSITDFLLRGLRGRLQESFDAELGSLPLWVHVHAIAPSPGVS